MRTGSAAGHAHFRLALRTPAPSAAQVHRQVTAVAEREGWPVPSYSSVYAIIRGIDPALRTLAVEGTRRYAEVFELQTALALRQAIWRKAEPGWHVCGVPAVLYTDHGSDFTSRHLEQAAADLGMRLVFSLPGYAPRGTRDRAGQARLSLAELDAALGEFIVRAHNHRVHSETGQPPQARREAGGFLPRQPESLEQLDLLLLAVAKPRKIHPDGIRFQGLRYLDPVLAAYVGESVIIRYDPRDLAEIRVFHRGRFLARAICADLAAATVSLKEVTAARHRQPVNAI